MNKKIESLNSFNLRMFSDIDECSEEGFCSHRCTNSPGSYTCTCQSGYDLVNRTCYARGKWFYMKTENGELLYEFLVNTMAS